MDRKKSALNLAPRTLVLGAALSFSTLVLLPADARSAETQSFQGSVHKHDRTDVVPIQVEGDSTINATLKWQKPQARMKLMLKRPNGTRAAIKAGGAKPKSISRPVSIAGTWRVVVKARTIGSPYNLQLTVKPGDGSEPPPPPPPPPPPGESCEGVAVSPVMDVQATIDAHPEGTTFCFASGTYHLEQAIIPKSDDALIATPGAILDGGDTADGAIRGFAGEAGQQDVTVRGFVAQNFANSITDPAKSATIKAGWDWTIQGNEVRHNRGEGIRAGRGSVIKNNYVHHNGKYGIFAFAADSMLWEGNEIAYNNTDNHSFADAGATKIAKSAHVTFRDNYVHHNNGHGLWADTDNIHFVYEDNLVEFNVGIGIFHEVSYQAVIRNNVVRYNAESSKGQSIGYGSNLQVSASPDVEIYGNTVVADPDTNGIGIHDADRGTGAYGEYKVANVSVHDNVVKMQGIGKTGLHGYRPEAYTAKADNRFWANSYYVTDTSAAFWYWQEARTWPSWRSRGQDLDGSLNKWSG